MRESDFIPKCLACGRPITTINAGALDYYGNPGMTEPDLVYFEVCEHCRSLEWQEEIHGEAPEQTPNVHTLVGPAAMDKLIEIYLCGFGSGVVTCFMSALGDKVGAEEFARGEADGLTHCMDRDPLMVERIRDEIIEILSGTETPKRRPLKVVLP